MAAELIDATALVETAYISNTLAHIAGGKCEYTCENDVCDFRDCEQTVNDLRLGRYPNEWSSMSACVVHTVANKPHILCPGKIDGFLLRHEGRNVLHMKNASIDTGIVPVTALINSRQVRHRWFWDHPAVRPAL